MEQDQTEIRTTAEAQTVAPVSASVENTPGLDDLLDDIENMVGDDAQNFVKGFVQKGGE